MSAQPVDRSGETVLPCPHVVQDVEGTAFCDLAEGCINAIGGRLRMAQKENERLRALLVEVDLAGFVPPRDPLTGRIEAALTASSERGGVA